VSYFINCGPTGLLTGLLFNPLTDDSRAEDKSQDGTHVALPLGAQSAPTSEAHVVVRPIVNIIVPNNRADLLSTGG